MAIENFKEVTEYFETNKDVDEVKNFIEKVNPLTGLTDDTIDAFVEKTAILKSARDRFTTNGVETYKTNTMPDKIKEALDKFKAENYPDETPEQKAMKEMKADLLTEKAARLKSEILNKAIKYSDKKIPVTLVDFAVTNDLEETIKRIDNLERVMKAERESAIKVFTKENGRIPEKGNLENIDSLQKRYNDAKAKGDTVEMMKLSSLMHKQKNKQ